MILPLQAPVLSSPFTPTFLLPVPTFNQVLLNG